MKKTLPKIPPAFLGIIFLIYPWISHAQNEQTPLAIAQSVADKVIRETVFDFQLTPRKQVLGMQVINFRQVFGENSSGVGYALGYIISQKDTLISFGVSSSAGLKIRLNDKWMHQQSGVIPAQPVEIAYNLFTFQDTLKFRLQKGENRILLKSVSHPAEWAVFLRPINAHGEEEKSAIFSLQPAGVANPAIPWLCAGPFSSEEKSALETVFPPEQSVQPFYTWKSRKINWQIPPKQMLAELLIPETNTYKRESYAEWHYANGALMMAFIALSGAGGEKKYADFARCWCDFILEHHDYFKWQYENLHAYRGSYHRIFRRTMLDDSGAPALPFAELSLRQNLNNYQLFLEPVTEYIIKEQARLTDGTFCRPEPTPNTLWADDLFMSVPFLLRMGNITGDRSYFDDAARQIIQFNKRLFNPEKRLYKHVWFGASGETSIAYWGRANGWIIWGTAEALAHLPEDHPQYQKVLEIFRAHIAGLIEYQAESGRWHQVLDHPESYQETSCTAMFVLGMARGVRNGWLDESYREKALRGWQGITQKIKADGTVQGICRGTGIGNDLEFYFTRETFDHDPRGLGAVITAGIEIDKLKFGKE